MIEKSRSIFKTDLKMQSMIVTLLIFVFFAVWLGQVVSRGMRSIEWIPVTSEIVLGLDSSDGGEDQHRWRRVEVEYTYESDKYLRYVDVFAIMGGLKTGSEIMVFVNPDDPEQMTATPGVLLVDYGLPLAGTLGSLVMAIVILSLMYNPKDN